MRSFSVILCMQGSYPRTPLLLFRLTGNACRRNGPPSGPVVPASRPEAFLHFIHREIQLAYFVTPSYPNMQSRAPPCATLALTTVARFVGACLHYLSR